MLRYYLFLDYDGTLVPFAPTPEQAVLSPELLELLKRLARRRDLRVAVISGRDLKDLLSFLPVPGLYLVACHGGIIKEPGSEPYCLGGSSGLEQLKYLEKAAADRFKNKKGFLLEPKAVSLAFHYRLADPGEAGAAIQDFITLKEDYCPGPEWELMAGSKVIEVRRAGVNKGGAVLHLLEQWPGAVPVYFGDDVTDEDAFRALKGRGYTFLVAHAPRPTSAQEIITRDEAISLLYGLQEKGRAALPKQK